MHIYVYDNYNYGYQSKVWNTLLKYSSQIEKNNIYFTKNVKDADIILCNKIDSDILELLYIYVDKFIILMERNDSCCISSITSLYLDMDEVLAVFKEYSFIEPLLNIPVLKQRHHYTFICQEEQKCNITYQTITSNQFQKIRCVPWNFDQYSHLSMKSDMKFCSDAGVKNVKKDIDIFYVVHEHENDSILYKHRKNIKRIVDTFKDKYNVVTDTIKCKKQYLSTLCNSRIIICPYGFGTRIAADQFTLLSKGVLLKPDSSFLKTIPNIYIDTYYTPFKTDLSDLESIINQVLNNYEVYSKKSHEANTLLEEFTIKHYIDHFCENIQEVWDKCQHENE